MKKMQKLMAAVPVAGRQARQLFYTSREDTASETILKIAMGPLVLWAAFYSVLPWLLG